MVSISYSENGDIVEVVVKEWSGRKLDKFIIPISDKKKWAYVLRLLKDKYGFEPSRLPEDSPNSKRDVDFWGSDI